MKVTTSALFSGLCWSARLVSADSANIYTFDPQSPARPQPRTLDPVAARLVVAQRAGVEDYHRDDLREEPEDIIAAINDYGRRTPLFAEETTKLGQAVILLEEDASIPSLEAYTSFSVSPVPATWATRGLLIDLAKQSDPHTNVLLSDVDIITPMRNHRQPSPDVSGNSYHFVNSTSEMETLFRSLVDSKKWSITAITIPAHHERNDDNTWGTWRLPDQQAILKKRQQRASEQILTDVRDFQPVQSAAPLASNNNKTSNNTTPLRGILPACYNTQEHCEKATRNCSGHGSCSKKYHDPDSGSSGMDCFSCSCKDTVVKNKNGKKTTKWGGPACQKKDISIEFWLIALFTVGLMFLVSFAVGSVWEMGSEELPSVIGAGVSGPTARK